MPSKFSLELSLAKIFAFILISVSFIACNDARNRDNWIVGTSADNPPYEFLENEKVVGFDIDVINAIAKHLGKTIEIKNMEFHSLLAAVSVENVDMVIAGLSVTSEREKRVKFSKPYSKAHIAILVRKDDQINAQNDLNKKIIGSQLGTSWTFIAKEIAEQQEAELVNLANNLILVEELKNQRLDAVILEKSQAKKFSQLHTELTYLPAEEYHTYLAIAYPQRAPIRAQIDEAITALTQDGTIDHLAQKWGVYGSSSLEIMNNSGHEQSGCVDAKLKQNSATQESKDPAQSSEEQHPVEAEKEINTEGKN